MRGSKVGIAPNSVGERFRLTRIAGRRITRADPEFEFDLNADVAAALLNVDRSSVWRWGKQGRRNKATGVVVSLQPFYPYPSERTPRAWYSLADLERFAATAWNRPRTLRYELIPHWYLTRHHRLDLADVAAPPPAYHAPDPELAGLPEDEREAIRRGFPRGAYVDGEHVYSPGGVLLNPGPDASETLRMAAAHEILAMQT